MIRVVLDASALVSGFPASAGTLAEIVDRWRVGGFHLVVSQHLIEEVGRDWTKPYWQARFTLAQVERALALLQLEAEVVPVTAQVTGVATHPEDDLVLASAVSASADYLVTGDKQLQRLGRYEGVMILSPRDFLALLQEPEDEAAV
ncbi:MAG: putative toxin-antitoxin system toxin component, PIN family [Chloroflexota bacterium]|nr:putative toxin-antitoxin system toxin component, PIN family [Chloroflexota bacterium]